MCMRNTDEGCVLSDQQHELTARVEKLERQMVAVQTVQEQMHSELQQGFADLKTQMGLIYRERAEWSQWVRENLPKVGRWLGKWSIILIGAAIGVNNAPAVVQALCAAAKQ